MRRSVGFLCTAIVSLLLVGRAVSGAQTEAASSPILLKAIEVTERIEDIGKRIDACILVAEAAAECGDEHLVAQALRSAERMAAQAPINSHRKLAPVCTSWLRVGLPDEALRVARLTPAEFAAVELLPDVAAEYGASGRGPEAAEVLQEAIAATAAQPNHVRAHARALAARAFAEMGRSEQARKLLREGEKLIQEPNGESGKTLSSVLESWAYLGDADAIRRLAARFEASEELPPALLGAAVPSATRGDQDMAEMLVRTAVDHMPNEEPLVRQLIQAGDSALVHGQEQLALYAAKTVEEVALQTSTTRGSSALNGVAALYSRLGRWDDVLRLSRRLGDDLTTCRYLVSVILDEARRGNLARVRKLLADLDPDLLKYAGTSLLRGLADVYLKLHPNLTMQQASSVMPAELRHEVQAAAARRAARARTYEVAIDWANDITFTPLRDEALQETTLLCLKVAEPDDFEAAARAARRAAKLLNTPTKAHTVWFHVGVNALTHGFADTAREAARTLESMLPRLSREGPLEQGHARIGILKRRLGQREDAIEQINEGIGRAEQISCGSCREEVLAEIYREIAQFADADLLIAALEQTYLPYPKYTGAITALNASADLTAPQRHSLLNIALAAAGGKGNLPERLAGYIEVARLYRRFGLEPQPDIVGPIMAQARTVEPIQRAQPTSGPLPTNTAHLLYFYRESCDQCRKTAALLEALLPQLSDVYIAKLDLDTEYGALLNEAIGAGINLPERKRGVAPAILTAAGALVDRQITEEDLLALIDASRGYPSAERLYGSGKDLARRRMRKRFESFGLLFLAGAGLVDGINPCAFTVIIFFLAYLAHVGQSRRQVFTAGIVFAIAVFVTYYAIGLGLRGLLDIGEKSWDRLSNFILLASAGLVLLAALLSLLDAIKALRGNAEEMALSLPDSLKSRIRRTISSRTRTGVTVGATFGLGALVALFEFPCTGQVYTPIIVSLRYFPELRWGAAGYLLIYNAFFIVPLLLVLVGVLFGLTSEKLTAFFRRHIALTKLTMAAVFIVLFAFLLIQIIPSADEPTLNAVDSKPQSTVESMDLGG